jgi:uncharacterized cupin superfamily protein
VETRNASEIGVVGAGGSSAAAGPTNHHRNAASHTAVRQSLFMPHMAGWAEAEAEGGQLPDGALGSPRHRHRSEREGDELRLH